MDKRFWIFDAFPVAPGWYAVLLCYENQEGTFPSASYWDGSAWQKDPVVAFGEKRNTKEQAERLAYEHDPD